MDDVKYFPYGEKELAYLRKKDKKLSAVIDRVGHIERAVDDDLFSAVVHHIVGQQISTKAQATVWARVQNALGTVDAEHVLGYGEANLQSLGISFRKAEYITDFAKKVHTGEFDLISVSLRHLAHERIVHQPKVPDYLEKLRPAFRSNGCVIVIVAHRNHRSFIEL